MAFTQSAETEFAVGQIWTFAVPSADSARVRIGRIEDGGRTLHVPVWGVPAPQARPDLMSPLIISHLPVSDSAMRASVGALTTESAPGHLKFEEGYAMWKEADGGVFTMPLPEVIDALIGVVRGGETKPAT